MISKKHLVLICLISMSWFLMAIPVNTIVTIPMPFPMKATQDGSIIVGQSGMDGGALVWTEANGVLNFGTGNAYDISENHVIAADKLVENNNQQYLEAGYYNMQGQFTGIGNVPGGQIVDGSMSTAYAISGNGNVIAGMGWKVGWTVEAFKWTSATGMVGLCPTSSSRVNSVSFDGAVAGGWTTAEFGNRVPVYWDAANVIHNIAGAEDDGEVMGVSNNGLNFCGYLNGYGFTKIGAQTYTFSATDPQTMVFANYVNNSGTTVGLGRNLFMMTQEGFVYNQTMGYVLANNYFQSQGVTIPEDVSIIGVSWVSDDNRTFIGFCYTNDGPAGFIVKLSEQAQISGTITLNGGNGNLTDVVVTDGVNTVHPNTQGLYSISVAPGTLTLNASLNGYVTAASSPQTVTAGQQLQNINLTLNSIQNPAIIQGTVILASGNGNVSAVNIAAGSYSANPDQNGNYSILIPAGNYAFSASLSGYNSYSDSVSVTANQTINKNITLYDLMTPSYLDVVINNNYTYDLTGAQISVGNDTEGYNYFDASANHLTGTVPVGIFNIALILPGYKTILQENVDFAPNDTVFISLSPEKFFPAPQNLSGTPLGLLNWDKPVAFNAFTENFEDYPLNSSINYRNPMWKAYNGQMNGENDAFITNEQAFEGAQSLKLNETTDILVDLNNFVNLPALTTGKYIAQFDIYVPSNKCAHYNIMRSVGNFEFAFEAFFKQDGTLKYYAGGQPTIRNYTHNTWIHVKHEIDLDQNIGKFFLDNQLIATWAFDMNAYDNNTGTRALAVIDFSGEPEPESGETGTYYLDDFSFYNVQGPGPDSYKVYYDTTPVASGITDLFYQLHNTSIGNHIVAVSALYDTNESFLTSVNLNITANDNNTIVPLKDLVSNYPNPFNPSTNVSFNVANDCRTIVEVYNLKGQKVKTLHNQFTKAGKYSVIWNGTNQNNNKVGSGVYFLRLKTDTSDLKKKIILLK